MYCWDLYPSDADCLWCSIHFSTDGSWRDEYGKFYRQFIVASSVDCKEERGREGKRGRWRVSEWVSMVRSWTWLPITLVPNLEISLWIPIIMRLWILIKPLIRRRLLPHTLTFSPLTLSLSLSLCRRILLMMIYLSAYWIIYYQRCLNQTRMILSGTGYTPTLSLF